MRRAKVKELIQRDVNRLTTWRIDDERTYYKPAFFEKRLLSGDTKVSYVPKYKPVERIGEPPQQ